MNPDRSSEDTDTTAKAPGSAASPSEESEAARRVAELEKELAEAKDQLLRNLAEQENVRRRAQRERTKAVQFAASDLVLDLLTTADNLRHAIDSIAKEKEAGKPIPQLVAGIEATERALSEGFEKHGIHRIEPLGQPFDPNLHMAVFEQPDEEHPAGTVIEVIQPGFLYHQRLLRPAMVGVSTRPEAGGPAEDC